MSQDFFSICAVLPAEAAHRLHRELSTQETLGPLVGPAGQTLFEFRANGVAPDYRTIAAAYKGKRPAPKSLTGAWVEIGIGTVDQLTGDESAGLAMSSGFASLVVIDRVLGVPQGNPILGGHALARIHARNLKAFSGAWKRLLADAGGAKKAATILAPYLDRGDDGRADAVQAIEAMDESIAAAMKTEQDLLLVCCPVP